MCGIAGIIDFRAAASREHLQAMCDAQRHRGPDDEGIWLEDNIGLGHRRLSIIDLASGHQPMLDDTGNFVIVFNGEIYNFQNIAEELKNLGVTFTTRSDTEVLLKAFRQWGPSCLEKINGMYAFAIWDRQKKELFLARDRLGKKPLHYFLDDNLLVFASELKGVLAHPKVKRELCPNALSKFLAYDYVPSPRSIFRQIRKIKPGCYAQVKGKKINERPYWKPCFTPMQNPMSEKEIVGEIQKRIRAAVERRLISDVPLGVFLSGGVDSSAIVAYMAQLRNAKDIKTFSIAFDEKTFDEREYSNLVAKHFGTDHHQETFSAQKALELVPNLASILDEPMADPSILPTYLLSKFTRASVTVALGGDGGDEVFVGYENYRAMRMVPWYLKIPRLVRRMGIERMAHLLPTSENNISLDYKIKRFLKGIDFPLPVNNYVWLGGLTPAEQRNILTNEFYETLGTRSIESLYDEVISEAQDYRADENNTLSGLLPADMRLYLQDDILVKADRASMAASLELRAPLLDFELVDFVTRLPLSQKFPGRRLKLLLKKAVEGMVPQEIIDRPKKGFGIPVARWLKHDLKGVVDQCLDPARLKRQNIFKPEVVQKIIKEHQAGIKDNRKVLWALLIYQLWCEKYFPI